MNDFAYAMEEDNEDYEVINGQVYMMSRPSTAHMKVELNIATIFKIYLKGKSCVPFNENDVFFDDDNNFVPDVMIVCNPDIIKERGIFGTPDLVVEILSPSTAIKDKMDKFFAYERYGVKEYWIVSPREKSVEVYQLKEGKLERAGYYQYYTAEEYADLTEKQKALAKREIKVSLYDDLYVTLEDIFENVK